MQREFTSNDLIALTGISARQLQWWDERGIVAPARKGHRRIYSWDELVTVAVICRLRRRGFSLQRMRKVIRFLQQEFGTSLAATVRASSEYHLLTDGTASLSADFGTTGGGPVKKCAATDVRYMPQR